MKTIMTTAFSFLLLSTSVFANCDGAYSDGIKRLKSISRSGEIGAGALSVSGSVSFFADGDKLGAYIMGISVGGGVAIAYLNDPSDLISVQKLLKESEEKIQDPTAGYMALNILKSDLAEHFKVKANSLQLAKILNELNEKEILCRPGKIPAYNPSQQVEINHCRSTHGSNCDKIAPTMLSAKRILYSYDGLLGLLAKGLSKK